MCSELPHRLLYNPSGNHLLTSVEKNCFILGQCHLTIITSNNRHLIEFKYQHINEKIFYSSVFSIEIDHNQKTRSLIISPVENETKMNSTEFSTKFCFENKNVEKRALSKASTSKIAMRNKSETVSIVLESSSSLVLTFNSTSFIDFYHSSLLTYPLRLSVRFRTLGRISNGVLLSLTHRQTSSNIIPYIIIEHSNGKIEVTILQLDDRKLLSPVTVSFFFKTRI